MDITINGVNITLTKEQLSEIDRQLKKKMTIADIGSHKDACAILDIQYKVSECLSEQQKLKDIIKAANYLDNNNKLWEPDFTNTSELKYIPYFERKRSSWVLCFVYGYGSFSYCPLWCYFKSEKTAKLFAERFINIYNEYLG